jgi:hypothetical protein
MSTATAPRTVTLLGHQGTVQWPVSLADIIGAEAVEAEAGNNLLYRGVLPKLRKAHIEGLSAATQLKVRSLDPEGKKFPTDQKAEADLLAQFVANGGTEAEFNAIADKVAREVMAAVDVPATLRSLGTGQIGEAWLEAADDLIAKVQAERGGDFTRFVAAMRTKVPTATLDDDTNPSRENVASILKAYDKAKRAEDIQY